MVDQLGMVNVARQVETLNTLPVVRRAGLSRGVRVVGLFFDISSARLFMLDHDYGRFLPLPGAEDAAASLNGRRVSTGPDADM